MTEPTAGPWLYQPDLGLISGDGWTVCDIPTDERRDYHPGERDANGRLLAASRELLEALKGIIDLVAEDCQHEARAAIVRATSN